MTTIQAEYRDLAAMARGAVNLTESPEAITDRVLDAMTVEDWRAIAYDVMLVKVRDEQRRMEMAKKNSGARGRLIGIVPRDVSQTLERSDTRAKESEVARLLEGAVTIQQRAGAFMLLASDVYRVPEVGPVHARDMTRANWIGYRDAQIAQRAGFDQSIKLANDAISLLDEAGVSTLADILYEEKN